MEYVYGFTSDNEKVIIGTVEEIQPGFTVVIPSGYTPDAYLMVSVNGGTAQTMSSLLTGGRTLNNVESLYFTSSDSTYKGINFGKTHSSNSSTELFYRTGGLLEGDNNERAYTSGNWSSYSAPIMDVQSESCLLEFVMDITFTAFDVGTYKGLESPPVVIK